MRPRSLVWVLLAWAAAIGGLLLFATRDTMRIRRQFRDLAQSISKRPGEGQVLAAARSQRIAGFFAEECGVSVPDASLEGTYSRSEIAEAALRARSLFAFVSLRFSGLAIRRDAEREALVSLTVRVQGELLAGRRVDESHAFLCRLVKTGGGWLVAAVHKASADGDRPAETAAAGVPGSCAG